MKEAAKRRWAERKARESDEHQKELELEAYHKGNVVPIKKAAPKLSSEPILLSFETDPAIHKQIIEEAAREGRSVQAHLSWLMRCLYDPPTAAGEPLIERVCASLLHLRKVNRWPEQDDVRCQAVAYFLHILPRYGWYSFSHITRRGADVQALVRPGPVPGVEPHHTGDKGFPRTPRRDGFGDEKDRAHSRG